MTAKPRTEKQERAAEALRAIAAHFEAMRPEVLLARAEAAEKDAEAVRRKMVSNAANLDHAIEMREAALARCATLEAERDDLLHAFQEIWDDWCSGHMGDCNCVVCSLTADSLNIDRTALAAATPPAEPCSRCATLEAALEQERLDHAITRSELEKACRLGPRVATLEAALREIEAIQPRLVGWLRDNGIVFHRAPLSAPPESDDERWEQIAFSIYTHVCEVDSAARAVLAAATPPAECQHPRHEMVRDPSGSLNWRCSNCGRWVTYSERTGASPYPPPPAEKEGATE